MKFSMRNNSGSFHETLIYIVLIALLAGFCFPLLLALGMTPKNILCISAIANIAIAIFFLFLTRKFKSEGLSKPLAYISSGLIILFLFLLILGIASIFNLALNVF